MNSIILSRYKFCSRVIHRCHQKPVHIRISVAASIPSISSTVAKYLCLSKISVIGWVHNRYLVWHRMRPVNSIRLFSVWPVFEYLNLHAVSLDFLNFFVSPPPLGRILRCFNFWPRVLGQNGEFLFTSFSRYRDPYPHDFWMVMLCMRIHLDVRLLPFHRRNLWLGIGFGASLRA
jgi:hypothetical protein